MSITQYEGILSQVDKDGNVVEMYPYVKTDDTLALKGKPADAAATGATINNISTELRNAIIEAVNIAKGRNQAVVYETYSEMIEALSLMGNEVLKRGYNIYVATPSVPDLWVYSVEENSTSYEYVNDDTFANAIKENVTVQIGYYKVAQLETQKVDLTSVDQKLKELEERMKTMTTYEWNESTATLNIITT